MGHPNDSLCEQNTPHRRTERQGEFYPNLAFLGLDKLADFPAEILFHSGSPPLFLPEILPGGIRFPTLVGKPISSGKWLFTKAHSSLKNLENLFNWVNIHFPTKAFQVGYVTKPISFLLLPIPCSTTAVGAKLATHTLDQTNRPNNSVQYELVARVAHLPTLS